MRDEDDSEEKKETSVMESLVFVCWDRAMSGWNIKYNYIMPKKISFSRSVESCTNEKKEITITYSVMASSFKNGNETQRYTCTYSALPVSYCIIHIRTCKGSWADSVFTLLPRHHSHCQGPLKVINVTLKPSFQRKKQCVPEHTHTSLQSWTQEQGAST